MIFPFLRCGLHLIAVATSAKITSTYLIFSNKENHTIERTKALPDVIGLIGMVSPLVRLNLIPEKMRKEIRNIKKKLTSDSSSSRNTFSNSLSTVGEFRSALNL